jgi:hypothetical protein
MEGGWILADQHSDRMLALRALQTNIRSLGARRLELRLGLSDVGQRRRASVVQILGKLECPRIILNGFIEQHLLRVFGAQREVIRGQLGVNRQIQGRQIRGACLLAGLGGCHLISDPAPNVDLIRQVGFQNEVVADRLGTGLKSG